MKFLTLVLLVGFATTSIVATPIRAITPSDPVHGGPSSLQLDPTLLADQLLQELSRSAVVDPGKLGPDDVEDLLRRSLDETDSAALTELLRRDPGTLQDIGKAISKGAKHAVKELQKLGDKIIDAVTGKEQCDIMDCARQVAPLVKECGEVVALAVADAWSMADGLQCVAAAARLREGVPKSCKECQGNLIVAAAGGGGGGGLGRRPHMMAAPAVLV